VKLDVDIPSDADWPALDAVLCQSFDIPTDLWPQFKERLPAADFRVARADGRVVAGLCLYRFAQFYGGRAVPSAGVAVVGVAPEARGSGAGSTLVAETLRGLHAEGMALSSLYPATRKPYRRVGYEVAGSRVDWELATDRIGLADRRLPARSVPAGAPALRAIYRRWAEAQDGLADRSETLWLRASVPYKGPMYAYEVGDGEGYVSWVQEDTPSNAHAFDLKLRDFAALTPAAARRIWTLLADHGSIAAMVRWQGPAVDPRLAVLPEVGGKAEWTEQWMGRIVSVPAALEGRGYRGDGVLDLELTDPVLPANAGRWRLTVEGGVGRVQRGGEGTLRATVGGLAAVYGGFLAPVAAAQAGLVDGPAAALAVAARLFAGPGAWLGDRF